MSGNIPSLRQLEYHNNDAIRFYHNFYSDDYPAHWHMSYEIIMPEDNIYTVIVENTTYELYPGDILIIPSGVVHEIFAPVSGSRYIIMLERAQIESIEELRSYEHVFFPCLYVSCDMSLEAHSFIKDCFLKAVMEHENNSLLTHASVKAYMELLLISAVRLKTINSSSIESNAIDFKHSQQQLVFADLCAYISSHCSEPLTPNELAARAGYSRFHFEKLFRSYVGKTLHEFVTLQRINMVKRLLFASQDSITNIALKSGFSSIATFNRAFQTHEGMSPTEYRSICQILPRT